MKDSGKKERWEKWNYKKYIVDCHNSISEKYSWIHQALREWNVARTVTKFNQTLQVLHLCVNSYKIHV